ncbi:discoidin domain-containing protein [Streptantibioticus cattleyicolor]|uniref:APHP domain protein n=1 Tax=Streptantibioticus cattleyicolor (strain ATCC 35852 / DSM 46488 / JCM 4925 / NBRC 14057 / NRRL 8057) TaxID=1003195 RepID=F8JL43_STREN|nr:discoidin domain-containing protein [Streptantibioticus cattleyicolor]AEW98377.1 APHP domain protein [Streptantibioticus cattleyicolor NRRL 8057 = DSM 46488]CCB72563.1 putative membrane protein [Streptantibioticus cattleyicolor NRRL 8057 = DSM 46488]
MRSQRSIPRLVAGVIAAGLLLLGGPAGPAVAARPAAPAAPPPPTTPHPGGRSASASTSDGGHTAARLADGDATTYWQSKAGSLPQWAQLDLGRTTRVDQVKLKMPASWSARTETLSLQASADGVSFATVTGSKAYTFTPSSGNTVTISFPATLARFVRAEVTANSAARSAQLSEMTVHPADASTVDLAAGKPTAESGHADVYPSANAVDGDANTYWESTDNAFPQWLRVDLGSAVAVNRVVLKLPPSTAWATRTQTLSVQGSTDGNTFSDLVASAGYTFDPATGNTVTIDFNQATTRYVRLYFTANTGWPAGQVSEFEVYGPASGDTTAPTAPTGLAYTQPAPGQITLTWHASTDNVGVTGYDVYANGTLRSSVAGDVLTYTDNRPDTDTVTYYVKARDAAGNQSPASNSVTRTGTSGDTQPPTPPGNLAYTQPAPGQIKLTWTAASDNVGVTGYEVFADGSQIATTAGDVLTYTDNRPDSDTVTYFVRAKDAAGNESGNSNTVTRTGTTPTGTNMALGKPISASSTVQNYVAANADDGDVTTYWEGTGTSSLTVRLGSNVDTSSVVVKLNPSMNWGPRTQTIEVQGREQSASDFTQLVAPKSYAFSPATGNLVSIPVSARVADVRLVFSANSGAGGGQAAELEVIGVPGPNPDLTISALTASPATPVETDPVTLKATVKNIGTRDSGATDVNFYLGTTKAGTAKLGALAAGASTTVSADVGALGAGSYQLTAKVDESNVVIEQNESNNSYTSPDPLVVKPVASSDLVASPVAWSPGNPSAGQAVTFSVAVKNQGTVASAGGSHGITLTVTDATTGTVVKTLTGGYDGTIAAGATTSPVALGSWTAANGKYTVKTVIAADANELPVKQGNNTSTQPLFVGRGADMPYDSYEAEDGVLGGGATVLGPNRTIGDPAGEASGREAVRLASTGDSVSFTTRAATNTLVVRFNIPDGPDTSLDVYVDGAFLKAIPLTAKYAWLYGDEASPGNNPGAGSPRHIYDEANLLLGSTVPAGHTVTLRKDAGNSAAYYNIDYIDLEQATPVPDPDPATYVVPAGFTQQDVQAALDTARQDTTKLGVYLPAGDYQTTNKFTVYGRPIKVIGAGPWFTRFLTPQGQENTDAGFTVPATAGGSTFTGFAFFGNYTSRIDGPGKVFDLSGVAKLTIDNLWIEHTVCGVWASNVDDSTFTGLRIRDTFADGINLTNGSTGNLIADDEARSTGDDSFALFPAIDNNNEQETGNTFRNLSVRTTWRAAGLAVYGGGGNTFSNLYIADTLTYSGITIGSLRFGGIPALGFESSPKTTFDNISLVRDGGHFWGSQTFPALWLYSAEYAFQGIRISDTDITDPTYSGIMFQTKWNGSTPLNPITDTAFTDITVKGARRSGDAYDAKSGFGLWANPQPEPGQGPAVGSVTFNGLHESDNAVDIENTTSTFTINVS